MGICDVQEYAVQMCDNGLVVYQIGVREDSESDWREDSESDWRE